MARVIGARPRVEILGPDASRFDLRRRYVATYPEARCLVDPLPADAVTLAELLDRLRARRGPGIV